jgi:hypothetical protein
MTDTDDSVNKSNLTFDPLPSPNENIKMEFENQSGDENSRLSTIKSEDEKAKERDLTTPRVFKKEIFAVEEEKSVENGAIGDEINIEEIRGLYMRFKANDESVDMNRLISLLSRLITRIQGPNGDFVQRICFNSQSPKILVTMSDALEDPAFTKEFSSKFLSVEDFIQKMLMGTLNDDGFLDFLLDCDEMLEDYKAAQEADWNYIEEDFKEINMNIENTITQKILWIKDGLKKAHTAQNAKNYEVLSDLDSLNKEIISKQGSSKKNESSPSMQVLRGIIENDEEPILEEKIRAVLESEYNRNRNDQEMRAKLRFYKVKKAFEKDKPLSSYYTSYKEMENNPALQQLMEELNAKIAEIVNENLNEKFLEEVLFQKHSVNFEMTPEELQESIKKAAAAASQGAGSPSKEADAKKKGQLSPERREEEKGGDRQTLTLNKSQTSLGKNKTKESPSDQKEKEQFTDEPLENSFEETALKGNQEKGETLEPALDSWFNVTKQEAVFPYEDILQIQGVEEIEGLTGEEEHEMIMVKLQGERVSKQDFSDLLSGLRRNQNSLQGLHINLSRSFLDETQVDELAEVIAEKEHLKFIGLLLNGYFSFSN